MRVGLAKRVGARLLLASTSEVYGDPEVHPQTEDYWGHVNPIGPRACYDEGKRVAETMCYAYMKQEGVEVRVARIFNTFGPRMHMNDGRVVSNFILQALQGEPLTVGGGRARGECVRSEVGCAGLLLPPSVLSANLPAPRVTQGLQFRPVRRNQEIGDEECWDVELPDFTVLSPDGTSRLGEGLGRGCWKVGRQEEAEGRSEAPKGNPEEHTILEFAQLIKNLVGK
ncbi:UDP-glucuronic acid decarboxylase 1, partial [Eschrichtius robustus]|nr:UDP-glucuronic acid decarboxylase 1 [Eschrichtius robustus]